MKFLATAPAADGVGEGRAGSRPGTTTSARASTPTRSHGRPAAAVAKAKSIVFDMSDEQPASFGATAGQGEWGIFQTFLKNPTNISGVAATARDGGRGRVQEGQVAPSVSVAAEASRRSRHRAAAPPAADEPGRLGRYLTGGALPAPASWCSPSGSSIPTIYTMIRSFFGQSGSSASWVWFDNYKTLFTTSSLSTAIKNNVIWVLVVPAFVTAIGLDLRGADRARAAGRSRSRPRSSCRWRSLRSQPGSPGGSCTCRIRTRARSTRSDASRSTRCVHSRACFRARPHRHRPSAARPPRGSC